MFNAHTHYAFENTAVSHMFGGGESNVIFNTSSVGANGEGYYVYVYSDRILALGRDFTTGQWVSAAQFAINGKYSIPQRDNSGDTSNTTDGTDSGSDNAAPESDVTVQTPADETAATDEKKKGCGAYISSFGVLLGCMLVSAVLSKKRKKV